MGLHTSLAAAFEAAEWLVEAETFCKFGEWRSHPGPLRIVVNRHDQLTFWSGEEDPDDPALVDLAIAPQVEVTTPPLTEVPAVQASLDGALPVPDLVARLGSTLPGPASAPRGARQPLSAHLAPIPRVPRAAGAHPGADAASTSPGQFRDQ